MILLRLDVVECIFKARLNRFVGEALIGGRLEAVHITNTGRLKEYLVEGRRCLAAPIGGRRLKYRLIGVEDPPRYAVIDTGTQSRAFEEAVKRGLICGLGGCRVAGREHVVEGGRLDYLLDCGSKRLLVESKSAVLRGPRGEAMYPDCPSDRGLRHVKQLVRLHESSVGVAIVFTAGMPGASCFKPHLEGDPRIYKALREAYRAGVPVIAYSIAMTRDGRVILENPCLPLCRDWTSGGD